MVFSSSLFLFMFLPIALAGYYLVFRKTNIRNYFLLFISLCFYSFGEPIYVFLMIASILANYGFGRAVDKCEAKKTKKIFLVLSVIFNLGILFCFKYLNFTADIINGIFNTGIHIGEIVLPIGISFFTFQAMSYVIDVYRGTTEVQRNPFYLGLYISFFPQLIAGPIVRYSTIEKQIVNRSTTPGQFRQGIYRFIQGFGKKAVIANVISVAAEQVFAQAESSSLTLLAAWLGSIAYTFQIFFDFSGYSDMAIGLGKMFGFEFEENFRYPYLSKSVSEFWNRWHISLGQWFRDYVYFPLGGSRVNSKLKLLRNLFVVWLLTGIWHGAAWQFILWGVAYGVIISAEKLTGFPKKAKSKPVIILYSVFTFLVVNFGWVIFGASDLSAAIYQLGAMFNIGTTALCDAKSVGIIQEYWLYFILGAIFSTPVIGKIGEKLKSGKLGRNENLVEVCRALIYLIIFIVSVSYLAIGTHNPFIYFNF